MSADLEATLKKHPSRILQLANKESLIEASRLRENADAAFSLNFANVVKLSEDQAPECGEPEG